MGAGGGGCRIAYIFGLFENLLCKPDGRGSFYILNIRFVTDPIMLAQLPSPRFSDFEILRFPEPRRQKLRRRRRFELMSILRMSPLPQPSTFSQQNDRKCDLTIYLCYLSPLPKPYHRIPRRCDVETSPPLF